jgi:hypothetical protein
MCTTTPTCTICCVCCSALSETKRRSLHACFQTLSGGLGLLQVAGSPSDGPTTNPGVTLDSDSCVSMSHQAPSTEDAPEAARAAGECMTAAREEVGISQESISTSSDAESAFTATTLKGTAGTGGRRSSSIWRAVCCHCHCHCLVGAAAVKMLPLPTIPRPRLSSFSLW